MATSTDKQPILAGGLKPPATIRPPRQWRHDRSSRFQPAGSKIGHDTRFSIGYHVPTHSVLLRRLFVMDRQVVRLLKQIGANDKGHCRNHDREDETGKDIPCAGDDGRRDQGQETTEVAVANVIGQRD